MSQKLPNNAKSRKICTVPRCSSYAGANIHLHRFPGNNKRSREWQTVLKIGKNITPNMYVCSLHFRDEDYLNMHETPRTRLRKRLKKCAVPSQNIPVGCCDTKQSTGGNKAGIHKSKFDDVSVGDDRNEEVQQVSKYNPAASGTLGLDKVIQTDLCFNLCDVFNNETTLRIWTGIDYKTLNAFEKCCANIARKSNKELSSISGSKIVLVMIKLKQNLSIAALAILFNMSSSNCSRCFYNAIGLLAAAVKPCSDLLVKQE